MPGRAGAPEALQAVPGSFRPCRDSSGVLGYPGWSPAGLESILSFFGIVICNVLIFR